MCEKKVPDVLDFPFEAYGHPDSALILVSLTTANQEVEEHLQGCVYCQQLAEAWRQTLEENEKDPWFIPGHPDEHFLADYKAAQQGHPVTPGCDVSELEEHLQGCELCRGRLERLEVFFIISDEAMERISEKIIKKFYDD